MKVIILRGISGAGKSTYANNMLIASETKGAVRVVSSDMFMTDMDGNYLFDFRKLPECHAKCLRYFNEEVQRKNHADTLIVDNTNLTLEEIAPYYALVDAYGHNVEIITITCDKMLAHSRNVHSVPSATIDRMLDTLHSNWKLPARWKHTII